MRAKPPVTAKSNWRPDVLLVSQKYGGKEVVQTNVDQGRRPRCLVTTRYEAIRVTMVANSLYGTVKWETCFHCDPGEQTVAHKEQRLPAESLTRNSKYTQERCLKRAKRR